MWFKMLRFSDTSESVEISIACFCQTLTRFIGMCVFVFRLSRPCVYIRFRPVCGGDQSCCCVYCFSKTQSIAGEKRQTENHRNAIKWFVWWVNFDRVANKTTTATIRCCSRCWHCLWLLLYVLIRFVVC